MKIKFDSGDNLPLNNILKLYKLAIVVRSFFHKENKYYPQFYFRWINWVNDSKLADKGSLRILILVQIKHLSQ